MKPTCKKCGDQHWHFTRCVVPPEVAEREAEAAEREATVTRINTQVVWRSGTPWGGDRLTSLDRIPGTNTFMRKPDNDDTPKAA